VTAFQKMTSELHEVLRVGSIGKTETLSLRPLPANNSVPGGALIGIFDGTGGGVSLVITAKGIARLHEITGEIIAKLGLPAKGAGA